MWGSNSSSNPMNHPRGRNLPKQSPQPTKTICVGTEAEAKKNQELNAKRFRYPAAGFVTPIEYTLLYAMLAVPTIYPESVMLEHIKEQDFTEFMMVKTPPSASSFFRAASNNNNDNEQQQQRYYEEEMSYSYTQLSALMNMAAEKWPPPKDQDDYSQQNNNNSKSVPQQLCRTILQTVVRHAEEHDLNREEQVQELLAPLGRLNEQKANQAGLALVVPMYLGLGVSMVTANPVPIWIGYAVAGALSANQTPTEAEQRNMRQLNAVGMRMADAEKTGLLDDSDE